MTITSYKEKQNDYPVMKKIVSFLTAGLVDYSDVDDGKYLLRKEAIEKMLPTLEGRPLVIGHQKIDPEHLDEVAVGYITRGYWNPETGSFDCDVLVKDAEVLNPSKNAVSCAYVATEFGEGGRYSGIDYDAEILNGEFTHIALVDNPRYNDAKILVNGLKKGANMMIKRFFSNADDEKKAEDEDKKENEDEETKELSPEDVVTVGNKDVTIKELVDTYVNACKNEDKDDKKNEDEDDKKNEDDEKDNEDDKKDNEDDEKKNAEVSESVKAYVDNAIKNALKKNEDDEKKAEDEKKDNEDKEEKQNSLSIAAMLRDYVTPDKGFETRAERIAESNKKYGL